MEQSNTPFGNRCSILGQLWVDYKNDEMFGDFVEYNDLGLPLAFAVAEGIVDINQEVDRYINETWLLLLSGLGLEDTGFNDLDDMLSAVKD